MSLNPTRREVLVGAAAVAAVTVLPVLPAAADQPAVVLWPTETQAQRQMVIVRAIKEHIAKKSGIAESDVTTDDIFGSVRYFGMSRDDVIASVEGIASRTAIKGIEVIA